jgi:hypothetical protein
VVVVVVVVVAVEVVVVEGASPAGMGERTGVLAAVEEAVEEAVEGGVEEVVEEVEVEVEVGACGGWREGVLGTEKGVEESESVRGVGARRGEPDRERSLALKV